MAVKLLPIWNGTQFFNSAGNVLSGGKIYQYQAGTTTPLATYTDATGGTLNANPLTLDSTGRYNAQMWGIAGNSYKLVLTDSTLNVLLTEDNLALLNDTLSTAVSEWIPVGLTPSYISATSFSVPGNVSGTLQVGRRLQSTVTAGVIYSTITSASFGGGITTVTVVSDSGGLDAGLSFVNYGLLGSSNESIPMTYITKPSFLATLTATQSSGQIIIYNSSVTQQGGTNYSSSTGKFTAPLTGWYIFSGSANIFNNSGAPGQFGISLIVNSVIITASDISFLTGGNAWLSVSAIVPMAAGQTAYIQGSGTFSSSGFELVAPTGTQFSGCLGM